MQSQRRSSPRSVDEQRVRDLFRRRQWKVSKLPATDRFQPDFIVKNPGHSYVVAVKTLGESRRDRALPLLSEAIVRLQAYARNSPARVRPLAVLIGRHVRESLVTQIEEFARHCAPDTAVGIVDVDGGRRFIGSGLEGLNASATSSRDKVAAVTTTAVYLFSDLNQWLLKVLLGQRISEGLLAAPRQDFRNPLELAQAANVSSVTAYRLIRQLRDEGFLHETSKALRLVRIERLLRRWQGENAAAAIDVPMRWVLRGDQTEMISRATSASKGDSCLGLFAAADALGLGFVKGVPPYLLVESLTAARLRSMGMSPDLGGRLPDVLVRVPTAPQSVFRGAVERRGVPVADAIQIWLDVSSHPSRGPEQAELIWRRVLQPVIQ